MSTGLRGLLEQALLGSHPQEASGSAGNRPDKSIIICNNVSTTRREFLFGSLLSLQHLE